MNVSAGSDCNVDGVVTAAFLTGSLLSCTIDGASNTISNITTAMFALGVADTSAVLASNSDTRFPTQKAVKSYVDNAVTGLFWKNACDVATTTAGTLATSFNTGTGVIDGVTLVTLMRILIKNQTTASENGIYIVQGSGAPIRATDSDTSAEIISEAVMIKQGTVNAHTQWVNTNTSTITLGTTGITYSQIAGGNLLQRDGYISLRKSIQH